MDIVCEDSPVLRSRLQADTLPLGAVALPLSPVLLPQTAGQLGRQHRFLALLQDGTDWHGVRCGESCPQKERRVSPAMSRQ